MIGFFNVSQICDMGQTALPPFRRKACWGFFRPKNPTVSAGANPRSWVPETSMLTTRPPKVPETSMLTSRPPKVPETSMLTTRPPKVPEASMLTSRPPKVPGPARPPKPLHVQLTTLPPSCADCLEIWESDPPGTLRTCQELWWDCCTFHFHRTMHVP
jgi:hypothetical protein